MYTIHVLIFIIASAHTATALEELTTDVPLSTNESTVTPIKYEKSKVSRIKRQRSVHRSPCKLSYDPTLSLKFSENVAMHDYLKAPSESLEPLNTIKKLPSNQWQKEKKMSTERLNYGHASKGMNNSNSRLTFKENKHRDNTKRRRRNNKDDSFPTNFLPLSNVGDRVDFQMHGHKGPNTYIFGFDTGNGQNRQYRLEERHRDGTITGQYGYYDAEGKLKVVKYVAAGSEDYQERHHERKKTVN